MYYIVGLGLGRSELVRAKLNVPKYRLDYLLVFINSKLNVNSW